MYRRRDIKPENILFTANMKLKLCDFGLAINMREERAVTRAGTLVCVFALAHACIAHYLVLQVPADIVSCVCIPLPHI
jgi:serine/threonine protein kinase